MLDEAARHAARHGVVATWIEAPGRAHPRARAGAGAPGDVRAVVPLDRSRRRCRGGVRRPRTRRVDRPGPPRNRPRRGAGPATPIPHEALRALVRRYLGPHDRAGAGLRPGFTEPSEAAIARNRFRTFRKLHAPGRSDIVRDVDGVIDGYLSTSFAAPHQFGDELDAFVADARELLLAASPNGRFWDWPGDTWILVATKP